MEKTAKKEKLVTAIFVIAGLALGAILGWIVFAGGKTVALGDSPSEAEVVAGRYNDQQLAAQWGDRGEFIPNSTLAKLPERKNATGFYDAVTYGITSDFENWFYSQLLRNPVYGDGARQCLQDASLIGSTSWVQAFAAQCDANYAAGLTYEPWLDYKSQNGKILVTQNYHLAAAKLATIFKASDYIGIQNGWTVKAHWPLAPDAERCYKSTTSEPYGAHVFRFSYKDGTIQYIGVNVVDGRFMILEPPSDSGYTPSSKATATTTSSGGSTPEPDVYIKDPSKDPVYQGNAQRGGGKNQESDGTGDYQPTRPAWQDSSSGGSSSSGSSSSSGGSSGGGGSTPSADPIPVHPDSHDSSGKGAGSGNGEFS